MSIIIAYKKNGIVYMGADTQTTSGDYKYNSLRTERIKITVINNILVGSAGNVSLINIAKAQLSLIDIPNDLVLTKRFIVEAIVSKLHKNQVEKDKLTDNDLSESFGYSLILAKDNNLFIIESDGSVREIGNWVAIGLRAETLTPLYRNIEMSASDIILKGLNHVANIDESVSKPYITCKTDTLNIIIHDLEGAL